MDKRPHIRSYPEQFGAPGASLHRAWVSGLIDRSQYEAGRRLAMLWQHSGRDEQQARMAAGRALLPLGDATAYTVASVCRDNGGVGNPNRASLLRQGLSRLASHFAGMEGFANG